jgi:SAM-dependent methyltransferase
MKMEFVKKLLRSIILPFFVYKNPIKVFSIWIKYTKNLIYYLNNRNKINSKISYYPDLTDLVDSSGYFGPYIYQDLWAFKHILKIMPMSLVDVASSTYFITFASSIIKEVKSVDIRILHSNIANIEAIRGDVTNLPFEDNSQDCVSSLCVIEHVGLGRYGDKIDLFGMDKAANELKRIIKVDGYLLVSFPVGRENNIEFNLCGFNSPQLCCVI